MQEATDADWRDAVLQAELPVVVFFWAPWSGGAKQFRPVLEQLAKRHAGCVDFMSMNLDTESQVPTMLQVRTLPSLAFVHGGEVLQLVPGVKSSEELTELLQRHFSLDSVAPEPATPEAGTQDAEADAGPPPPA